MKLWEIKDEIEKCFSETVDEETGEILSEVNLQYLEELQMAFDDKVDNICCLIKNMDAEVKAFKTEEANLKKRRMAKENASQRLKDYLKAILNGQKFESVRSKISYRSSKSTEVDMDLFLNNEDADFYVVTEIKPNKTAIKKALEDGKELIGAEIVENQSMIIK
jgi:hypothetical protein